MKMYLHYSPEFDLLTVMLKKRTCYFRSAFRDNLKGMTKLVFIAYEDFGFTYG